MCLLRSLSSCRIVRVSSYLREAPPNGRRWYASSAPSRRTVRIYSSLDGPPIDYARGWAWQTVLLQQHIHNIHNNNTNDSSDALLLLEHNPVYTLGRGADPRHLTVLDSATNAGDCIARLSARGTQSATSSARLELSRESKTRILSAPPNACLTEQVDALVAAAAQPVYAQQTNNNNNSPAIPMYRVERGGEVTFHAPGQLVVYPLLHLDHYRRDLHWYLHQMEQVVIDTLALPGYGIECHRDAEHTGVWCGREKANKIAAVGVAASRWITTHGCAVNVRQPDATFLQGIQPCGIEGRGVTSIEEQQQAGNTTPTVQEVGQHVLETFQRIFNVQCDPEYTRIH